MDIQHSVTHMFCYWLVPRTNTAEPNAFITECAMRCHGVNFHEPKSNIFSPLATLVSRARGAVDASETQYSLRETTFGTRANMGLGRLGERSRVKWRGLSGPISGQPGDD